jgi:hypothetical protein
MAAHRKSNRPHIDLCAVEFYKRVVSYSSRLPAVSLGALRLSHFRVQETLSTFREQDDEPLSVVAVISKKLRAFQAMATIFRSQRSKNRASFRSREIRILDSTGNVGRTIPFNDADREM